MTELLHGDTLNREFSRKSFVKGGGALVVGFSVAGAGLGTGAASAAFNPDKTLVDSWVSINADNTATVRTSQIEPGNGVTTGLLMLVAEELDLSMAQVRHAPWDSDQLVNSGGTGGSNAVQSTAGPPLRAAAAYARQALLGMASTELGVSASGLSVRDGVVSGGGRSVTYGQLVAGKMLTAKMATPTLHPGVGPSKPPSAYTLLGSRVPRVDIPDKITGKYTYVHNVKLPGMLHGRVVRPRGQGPYGTGATILSVDASSIRNIAGARVVRKGNFIGVVAPSEFAAIQAAAQLKVEWQEHALFPSTGNLWKHMRELDAAGLAPARDMIRQGNVDAGLQTAAAKVTATYAFHNNGRMPIGPSCAVADVSGGRCTVYGNFQRVVEAVPSIASQLGVDVSKVRAFFYEGASSFGATVAIDVARAAAVMSQIVGKPVRVQLMRWDEHGWDNYGQAHLMDMRGGVDANGKIVAYEHVVFGQPSMASSGGARPDLTLELTGTPYGDPGLFSANTPNTGSMYVIPNKRVMSKTMPVTKGFLRTGSLRNPAGPQTAFGSEQLIDELAYAAKMDPVEFRRRNITDDRWLTAMNAAVQAAKWQPRVANAVPQSGNVVKGRGFAFGRHGSAAYSAAIAEIEVDKKTGKITATHIYNGMDPGLLVNPELAENQISGAAVHALSRALHEAVQFNRKRVTNLDWSTYPILRFKDAPRVTSVVVQRKEHVPLGVGEPPHAPIAAAVANAFFDATGVRIREAPMTPARVRSVLRAAGK